MNSPFQTSSRRDFFYYGGLATASSVLVLKAGATPTPATKDSHRYVNYLKATGAPFRGKVTPPRAPGEPLVMRGRIWSHVHKKPIANALLDVWQADHKGIYDFQTSKRPAPRTSLPNARNFSGGKQPAKTDFKNRIRLITDEEGYYEYETIKPAAYGVGNSTRPSHIHYMVQAKGHAPVITQCYFKDDPHIAKDPWASKSPLIIDLQKTRCEHGQYLSGQFDLVLGAAQA
jgi:catechol 1,2-dioxygenase